CLMANVVLCRMNGLPAGGMRGLTGRDIGVPPAEIERRRAALAACHAGGALPRGVRPRRGKGREWEPGGFTAHPPRPRRPRRAALIASDITAAKQAQLHAEFQSARLTLALDAAGMGVWDYDVAADVISWDERTRVLFDIDTLGPMPWDEFVKVLDAEEAPRIEALADAAMA